MTQTVTVTLLCRFIMITEVTCGLCDLLLLISETLRRLIYYMLCISFVTLHCAAVVVVSISVIDLTRCKRSMPRIDFTERLTPDSLLVSFPRCWGSWSYRKWWIMFLHWIRTSELSFQMFWRIRKTILQNIAEFDPFILSWHTAGPFPGSVSWHNESLEVFFITGRTQSLRSGSVHSLFYFKS